MAISELLFLQKLDLNLTALLCRSKPSIHTLYELMLYYAWNVYIGHVQTLWIVEVRYYNETKFASEQKYKFSRLCFSSAGFSKPRELACAKWHWLHMWMEEKRQECVSCIQLEAFLHELNQLNENGIRSKFYLGVHLLEEANIWR